VMYRIGKTFRFSAAHHLPSLPASHKCHAPHGHNYEVELHLAAKTLDVHGFVDDYGALATFKQWLNDELDHTDLNDPVHPRRGVPHVAAGLLQPSAELLAKLIYDECMERLDWLWVDHLYAVTVRETENTYATFRPS